MLSASFLAGRCGEQDIVHWVPLSLSRQPPVSQGRRGSTERDASPAVKEKHMGTSDLPAGLWGSCPRGDSRGVLLGTMVGCTGCYGRPPPWASRAPLLSPLHLAAECGRRASMSIPLKMPWRLPHSIPQVSLVPRALWPVPRQPALSVPETARSPPDRPPSR